MNLYYLLFLSCSRVWEKLNLSTSPSDNFFCILIFKLYSILELFTGLEKAQALVQA